MRRAVAGTAMAVEGLWDVCACNNDDDDLASGLQVPTGRRSIGIDARRRSWVYSSWARAGWVCGVSSSSSHTAAGWMAWRCERCQEWWSTWAVQSEGGEGIVRVLYWGWECWWEEALERRRQCCCCCCLHRVACQCCSAERHVIFSANVKGFPPRVRLWP